MSLSALPLPPSLSAGSHNAVSQNFTRTSGSTRLGWAVSARPTKRLTLFSPAATLLNSLSMLLIGEVESASMGPLAAVLTVADRRSLKRKGPSNDPPTPPLPPPKPPLSEKPHSSRFQEPRHPSGSPP